MLVGGDTQRRGLDRLAGEREYLDPAPVAQLSPPLLSPERVVLWPLWITDVMSWVALVMPLL